MHVHLPEADFGKLRIWRPKEVLYRYDLGVVVAHHICVPFGPGSPQVWRDQRRRLVAEILSPDTHQTVHF